MTHLVLKLFGTFATSLHGTNVATFRSAKTQALLAYLSVESTHLHQRNTLVDLLWPDYPPKDANANFRQALSRLQRLLGNKSADPPFLLVTRQAIQWNPHSNYQLDVAEMLHLTESLLAERNFAVAQPQLYSILDLYPGDFLAGFSVDGAPNFDDWMATTREHLHQQIVKSIAHTTDLAEADGQFSHVADLTRQQLSLSPWDEPAHRRLMKALALQGLRAEALAQYERCVEILERELNAPPEAATEALANQIREGDLQVEIDDLRLDPAKRPNASNALNIVNQKSTTVNLDPYAVLSRLDPLPDQTLFGVEAALETIMAAINAEDRSWLVSIDGIVGIGKTTLANVIVRQLVESSGTTNDAQSQDGDHPSSPIYFQDVGWVSAKQEEYLAEAGTQETGRPALDVETLTDALLQQLDEQARLAASSEEKQTALLRLLKERACLIVVDNLESVLDTETLLPYLRQLANPSKFLITSRFSLQGQTDIYSHSLAELSEADTLAFLRYESKARGIKRLANATDEHYRSIYQVVGGNPLALKLVMGQARFLSLSQVLDNLVKAQGKRIDQLYTYIYWQAWNMLDSAGRQLFVTMPMLPNGTFEQILAISGLDPDDALTSLERLSALSLIQIGGDLEEPRYRLHRLTETFLMHEVLKWQDMADSFAGIWQEAEL